MGRVEKILMGVFIIILAAFFFLSVWYIYNKEGNKEIRLYKKIKISYEIGEYDKALDYISEFVAEFSDSKQLPYITELAGEIMFYKKKLDISEQYVKKVIELKNTPQNVYFKAVVLLGKIYKVRREYNPIVLNYLEDAYFRANEDVKLELAFLIGYQYLFKKDFSTAISYFQKTTGENSLIGKARCFIEMGDYPDAISVYLQFFKLYPNSSKYEIIKNVFIKQTLYYAKHLKEQKQYEMALKYFYYIPSLFPNVKEADISLYEMASIYYKNKDYNHAMEFYGKVLNNSVTYWDDAAMYQIGVLYYEEGRKKEAAEVFTKFIEEYPSSHLVSKAKEWKDIIYKEIRFLK